MIPPAAARPPILLIEDTPALMLLYRSVLATAGLAVVTATTAAEGLNAFHSSGAKLVVLDMVLPDRNGLDLMHDLLRLRPDTHVIVMTAHGSINMAVDAMRAGAHEFLVKPFDAAKLLNAVANAGGIAVARRGAAKGAPKVPQSAQQGLLSSAVPTPWHGYMPQSPQLQNRWQLCSSPAKVAPEKSFAPWRCMTILHVRQGLSLR